MKIVKKSLLIFKIFNAYFNLYYPNRDILYHRSH